VPEFTDFFRAIIFFAPSSFSRMSIRPASRRAITFALQQGPIGFALNHLTC
jgi:hypothetical protein